jgi:hypothetical protein
MLKLRRTGRANGIRRLLCAVALAILCQGVHAVDNAHFYKTTHLHSANAAGWFDEERLTQKTDWLTQFDASYAYGDAGSCWDGGGNTTSLLNNVGNHNMLFLVEDVPAKPSKLDTVWFNENALRGAGNTNTNFGLLEFDGKFSIHNFDINLRQNLKSGFFVTAHLPIRDVSLKNITYKDLSPEQSATNPVYHKDNVEWQRFLTNFNTLLANYGLKPYNTSYSKTSIGDASLMLGWQGINDNKDEALEYLSLTLKAGVLFPSGSRSRTDQVFFCTNRIRRPLGNSIPIKT